MNVQIVEALQVLLNEAKRGTGSSDPFRVKAYGKAITLVKSSPVEITSGEQAVALGVGKKIAEKIDEIIATGSLRSIQQVDHSKADIIAQFGKIWGVGPVKARVLYDAGARTIADVCDQFANLLNDKQRIGLRYFDDFQKRVSRQLVDGVVQKIRAEMGKNPGWRNIQMEVCGSYRRQSETCGDMDILLCGEGILQPLVEHLQSRGILGETLAIGPTKYMGITHVADGTAFRIDMEVIPREKWAFALLYFTGSGAFNERQRSHAKKMGYSLSEHGLKVVKTGDYVPGLLTEEAIFKFLKMDYLPPHQRH